jgi:gluconate 2-dehydrogenase gamma chain
MWAALKSPAILKAAPQAARARAGAAGAARLPAAFAFFTKEQAADIDAMASQIIPTDDTPGAHEAGCLAFIDHGLTTFLSSSQSVYTQGLKDLQAKTKELFPSANKFSALTSVQQIQVLKAIEETPFFRAVRNHTITGMFASPAHGGNYGKVGWKLIDWDDLLNYKEPFGYYDAHFGS